MACGRAGGAKRKRDRVETNGGADVVEVVDAPPARRRRVVRPAADDVIVIED